MYDFKAVELSVSERWKQMPEIKKSMAYEPKKKLFSFLDGPPTANAPPALHHVEVRVFKDLVCRYKYMKGFTVPRKAGWDCHGLPVEVQVEKSLNLGSKKDVVEYGIANFVSKCKASVFSYIKEWDAMNDKMADWIDIEHPYVTLNNEYIESVWWSLKELFSKGMLYEGHKVVPLCPRCSTPLSSHEVALGYKDVEEDTVVVKFRVAGRENRVFLVWTTTPWTLPSNVALAVNPNIKYAVVDERGEEYIIAKDLAGKYFDEPEIREEIDGAKLVGMAYKPLFDFFSGLKGAFRVIPGNFVTTTEGTGIVHIAPAFGEVDYDACAAHGVPFIQPVDQNGKFTAEVTEWSGKFVKDTDPFIIGWLDNRDLLFRKEKYKHSYPFCWRCSTPLVYYAMRSWFIRVSAFRDKLLKHNERINWFPKSAGEKRFENWLASAKDWALSRSKFWGTPLPIWRCGCGELTAIGGIEELKKLGKNVPNAIDLHKPVIDEIEIKCPKCGKYAKRVPDVIDCWYDSGSATFAQLHYPFENKELFKKFFPYDFIAEAVDQTRGWFYTLHVLAVLLFDDVAYKNVVCAGHVVDENGEKMSKSKGNIIKPEEMFEQAGVDAVRLQMCVTATGEPKRFSLNMINEAVLPFLNILWNSAVIAKALSNDAPSKAPKLQDEDKWLISRANSFVKEAEGALEIHEYNHCVNAFMQFVNEDISRGYIKFVRERISENDPAVAYTLRYAFERLLKSLAPFAPYITDYLYNEIVDSGVSVHFSGWSKVEEKKIDAGLESMMALAQDAVQAILSAREKAQMGVRWPLPKVTVVTSNKEVRAAVESLSRLIMSLTNVKKVEVKAEMKGAKLEIKPNMGMIGKDFKQESKKVIAALNVKVLEKIRKEGSASVGGLTLTTEHIHIIEELPKSLVGADFRFGNVYIETTLTPELEAEGYARETVRRVQNLRKEAGLKKNEAIELAIVSDYDLKKWKKEIQAKVAAKEVFFSDKGFKMSEEKIKGKNFAFGIRKI